MDHPWDTSDNKKLMEIVDNYIDINKTINYFEISKIVNKPEKFIIEIVKYNVYLLISDTNPIESICARYQLDLDEVINCYVDNTKTTHYFTVDKDNIITLPTKIIEHYSKDKFCFCNNNNCISHTTSFKCGNCKVANYCSRVCQKADWKFHKVICNELCEKLKTKKDIKRQLYINTLMQYFHMGLMYHKISEIKHWKFYKDTIENKFVFIPMTKSEKRELNSDLRLSNILLKDIYTDITFQYLYMKM